MQKFIARENLKLYERKLTDTVDPHKQEMLRNLIDSERQHLRELTTSSAGDAI